MRQRSKRMIWLKVLLVITMGMLWCGALYAADIQNKLINFQGYLTDNANPPNPLDGTYDLTFRIYEKPGDLTPLWVEQHQGVTVIRGNVSVLLGSNTEMKLAFDEPAYLGIQVGTDPEMIPRQKLLPAFQATSANKLNVTHADGSKSEFDATRLVPIGLISPFFGDPAALPDNWMICDGSVVNDTESPLNGAQVPDLRARFVRGEENGARDLITSGVTAGGSDVITDPPHHHDFVTTANGAHAHSGAVHAHTLTIAQMPSHNHANGAFAHLLASDCNNTNRYVDGGCGEPNLRVSAPILAAGGNQAHSHGLSVNPVDNHSHTGSTDVRGNPSQDNRPAFVGLHYIIRIK